MHNLSKTLVWGIWNWHEIGPGSKFAMDFFFSPPKKTGTAKPFAKTEGNVDPTFSMSKPGGTEEGGSHGCVPVRV